MDSETGNKVGRAEEIAIREPTERNVAWKVKEKVSGLE